MDPCANCPLEPHSHNPKARVGFHIADMEEDRRIPHHHSSQHSSHHNNNNKRKSVLGIEIIDRNRRHWSGPQDFLFSMVVYAVGLGNIWRFPYLCYKNGGGSFLIAYIACFAIIGIPLFILEVVIGQYLQTCSLRMWKVSPIFRGVGIGNIILSLMCVSYFCVIVSWSLFYLVSSFNLTFPWETCDNYWNTVSCFTGDENITQITNLTRYVTRSSLESSVEQFWDRRVIQQSFNDITNFNGIQWELFVLMLFAWIVVYFALWNGVTETRKFVYFCSLFPYFLFSVLLIRGITLPGAIMGVNYFLTPNMTTVTTDFILWKDAATQVLFSYGIGFGTLITLGSHNKFHHNCYRDAFIMCFINACTSILTGLAIFSCLGYMAYVAGKDIDQIVKPTVGLIFVVLPEITRHLPLKQIWASSIFLMIAVLGLDTQICMLENLFVSFDDKLPFLLKKHRKVSLLFICVIFFLIGIPMISFGGIYWVTLMDVYGAASFALLFVVFFEVIGISWGFGTDNVRFGIYEMIGIHVPRIWKVLWNFTVPFTLGAIFIGSIIKYSPLKYSDGSNYPYWAEYVGFYLTLIAMVPIPIYALYYILFKNRQLSFRKRLHRGVNPPSDCSLATKTCDDGLFNERAKFLDQEPSSFRGFFSSSKKGKPARVERRGLTV